MPVERSTKEWNFSFLPQYWDSHNCIMEYQGEYIVADINRGSNKGFFGAGILESEPIMQKLESNYTMVAELSWTIYKKKEGR